MYSEIIQRMFWVRCDTSSRESWDFRVANITSQRTTCQISKQKPICSHVLFFSFFQFYFNLEIFSNLQKNWKNSTKYSHILFTQIYQLTFCLIWFIILYQHIFLNHFRLSRVHCATLYLNMSFSKNKNISHIIPVRWSISGKLT